MSINPEDQAREVAIQIEKQRLIDEREEDALLIAAGKPPAIRPDIPELRTAAVSLAKAELAEDDAERARMLAELERDEVFQKARNKKEAEDKAAKDAEAARISAAMAVLQAQMDALRPDFVSSSSKPSVHFDASTLQSKRQSGITTSSSDTTPTVSSFSGTYGDLLGDFLDVERSQNELESGSMQVISKADRLKLSASDKSKIYTTFIKGTVSKFKASSTIVGLDEISTIENIMSFSQLRAELQKHITSVSAHSVFHILKFDPIGNLIDPDSANGTPLNILSASVMPSIADVEKSQTRLRLQSREPLLVKRGHSQLLR